MPRASAMARGGGGLLELFKARKLFLQVGGNGMVWWVRYIVCLSCKGLGP